MKALSRVGAALGAAVMAFTMAPAAMAHDTGTENGHDKPSWQEFRSSTFRDTDGQYIVDGDVPISNTGSLFKFYKSLPTGPVAADESQSGGIGDLIVNTDPYSGGATLWSDSQVGNLTYCVSNAFGSQKASVVRAMNQGAATWENASSAIDFRYVSTQDGNCNTRNNNVTFSVEPTSSGGYIARAFFPNSPKYQRNVLVANQFYSQGQQQGPIMAHELGHVLGFRHEHTRPEAGTCFEDNNWQELTPYDSASIMHYPQCNGSTRQLSFSQLDRQGVQRAYGA